MKFALTKETKEKWLDRGHFAWMGVVLLLMLLAATLLKVAECILRALACAFQWSWRGCKALRWRLIDSDNWPTREQMSSWK